MGLIRRITQDTKCRFLNFFTMDVTHKSGRESKYFVASRAKEIKQLKAVTHENTSDGVIIYSVYGEKKDKIVLIRQYRYPIDDYIYEFPAGLVEAGEDFKEAGIRELKEETGLELEAINVPDMYSKPYFTTIGMTDESCGTVYGYAKGIPSMDGQEDSEEIQIVLADKEEVRRILKEENVAIMCAYMLMHFLESEDGNPFYFLGE
ncbi:MAG: NUDIX domain-containing protein [Lachnospiraceae bacterium]|nr:NUDIX domain-containing protein [Lachnospiraceae bacterium]